VTDDVATRGLRVLLILADAGDVLSTRVVQRIGEPELVKNTLGLIICALALDGPLRPRDLMAVTHLTSGGMTKQLDHLEQLGQIERSFGTVRGDRRAIVVTLTTDGMRTAAAYAAAVEDMAEELRTQVATIIDLLKD